MLSAPAEGNNSMADMPDVKALDAVDREIAMELINRYAKHIDRSIYKVLQQIPTTKELTFTFVTPSEIWDRKDIIQWVCCYLSKKLAGLGSLMKISAEGTARFDGPVIVVEIKWGWK